MTTEKLTPRPGHVVEMAEMPVCNFCGSTAAWDAPTIYGPWAYLCDECEQRYRHHPGMTGVGIGQRLIPREES